MRAEDKLGSMHFLAALIFFSASAVFAATFTNLDFEAVDETTLPDCSFPTEIPMAYAFPGWAGFRDTNPVSQVYYRSYPLDDTYSYIAMCDTNPHCGFGGSDPILEGDITILLHAGKKSVDEPEILWSVSIVQTGHVPSYARTLKFLTTSQPSDFIVEISTNVLVVTPIMTNSGIITCTADISAFADQDVEFKITAVAPESTGEVNLVYIDDIEFGWLTTEIHDVQYQTPTSVVLVINNLLPFVTNAIERGTTLSSDNWAVVHTYAADLGITSLTQQVDGEADMNLFRIRRQ